MAKRIKEKLGKWVERKRGVLKKFLTGTMIAVIGICSLEISNVVLGEGKDIGSAVYVLGDSASSSSNSSFNVIRARATSNCISGIFPPHIQPGGEYSGNFWLLLLMNNCIQFDNPSFITTFPITQSTIIQFDRPVQITVEVAGGKGGNNNGGNGGKTGITFLLSANENIAYEIVYKAVIGKSGSGGGGSMFVLGHPFYISSLHTFPKNLVIGIIAGGGGISSINASIVSLCGGGGSYCGFFGSTAGCYGVDGENTESANGYLKIWVVPR